MVGELYIACIGCWICTSAIWFSEFVVLFEAQLRAKKNTNECNNWSVLCKYASNTNLLL